MIRKGRLAKGYAGGLGGGVKEERISQYEGYDAFE